MHGVGVQFLTDGLVYEGEFEEGRRHGRGRQRRCPAAAEAIEDGRRAARAGDHVRRGAGLAHTDGGGVPDTRTALLALLGMGALVHEGCWVDDAAVGGRVPLDASFYRELRDRIGLARWECGRLTDV